MAICCLNSNNPYVFLYNQFDLKGANWYKILNW